jgi:hypothetical protein
VTRLYKPLRALNKSGRRRTADLIGVRSSCLKKPKLPFSAVIIQLCFLSVIFVPPGDNADPTSSPEFYDSTFNYLTQLGIPALL